MYDFGQGETCAHGLYKTEYAGVLERGLEATKALHQKGEGETIRCGPIFPEGGAKVPLIKKACDHLAHVEIRWYLHMLEES